jgi:hypothetical protein
MKVEIQVVSTGRGKETGIADVAPSQALAGFSNLHMIDDSREYMTYRRIGSSNMSGNRDPQRLEHPQMISD